MLLASNPYLYLLLISCYQSPLSADIASNKDSGGDKPAVDVMWNWWNIHQPTKIITYIYLNRLSMQLVSPSLVC